MNMREFAQLLTRLSDDDLNKAQTVLTDERRRRQRLLRHEFSVGDPVTFQHKGVEHAGTIRTLNEMTATVDVDRPRRVQGRVGYEFLRKQDRRTA